MAGDTWVCCEECNKWRRLSQELADSLDEDAKWTCKGNPDPLFNSCEIQQELTDLEIDEHVALLVRPKNHPNKSLNIPRFRKIVYNHSTQAQDDVKADDATTTTPTAPISAPEVALRSSKFRKRPSIWQVINKNIYTHRERKRQDEDEIMICQCPTIWATDTTSIGCGEHCLNRMLNIECVSKYCPCGHRCTNQAFSKRQYSKLDVKRAGAKGFGLFAAQDVKAGQFIIEYVGEVLEEDEYIRRKEFYTATGQRHYYFMNVGNGEVIDATRRGGMGRFINHSCQPNCETQKWVVRGEIAIGLFALEDISAGEELTFDYNFERYGDKPMKCLCGSVGCRGMIGGVQETMLKSVEAVIVPDEDNEPEPIMITEKEADNALSAILDRAVGLGWEKGFDDKLQKRLEKLTAQKGVYMPGNAAGGVDEEEFGADFDEEEEEDEGEEDEEDGFMDGDEEYAAAAKAAAAAAAAAAGKKKPKKKAAASKSKAPRRRARKADPDWGASSPESRKAQPIPVGIDDDDTAGLGSAATTTIQSQKSGGSIPKRSISVSALNVSSKWRTGAAARRSEVDRRIDSMITASGRLREFDAKTVVRLLRLFNLCDISPTITKAASSMGEQRDKSIAGNGIATANNSAGDQGEAKQEGEKMGVGNDAGAVLPAKETTTAASVDDRMVHSGTRKDSNLDEEGSSRPRSRVPITTQRYEDLTPRQRARIADLSILLDVVIKTTARAAQQEFLRCGILRQLLICIGHNTSEAFSVILRKALQVVDGLPATSDDMHSTRSAHGSFGDFLRELTQHKDYEVRAKAWGLSKKLPMAACTRPPTGESLHSTASAWTPRPPVSGLAHSSERPISRGGYFSPSPGSIRGMPPAGRRGGGRGGDSYNTIGPSRFNNGSGGGGGRFSSSFSAGRPDNGPSSAATWTPQSSTGGPSSSAMMGKASSISRGDDENGVSFGRKRSRWDMSVSDAPQSNDYNGVDDQHPGKSARSNGLSEADDGVGVHRSTAHGNGVLASGEAAMGGDVLSLLAPGGAPPPTFSPISDEEEDNTANPNSNGNENYEIEGTMDGDPASFDHGNGRAVDDDDDDDAAMRYDGDIISWDFPDENFEAFVADVVRRRVGKYEQPDHPARLSRDEAARLFRKIRREVVAREHEAYGSRRKAGLFKPIERGKLETRIKAYVRDSVHRWHTSQHG